MNFARVIMIFPSDLHFLILAGEYVGLTGARLDGAEMLACGLATHFVHSNVYFVVDETTCDR